MYDIKLRGKARALYASGMSFRAIGRHLNVPNDTVHYWCRVTKTPDSHYINDRQCPRCQEPPTTPPDVAQYNFLLGLYLGDGHLVTTAKTPVLRIACADAYPGIMDACEKAMLVTLARKVQRVQEVGCSNVQSYSKHWPCLLPQAGPGRKHEHPIVLESWQRELMTADPGSFLRGLFFSDGCRAINQVTTRGKLYAYPRYFLSNESADILGLCGEALDLLGIQWRLNRRNCLSVAKRDAVATLDQHVGPKS